MNYKENLLEEDESSKKQMDLFFNKLGYGRYQWLLYFVLLFVLYTDAVQMLYVPYVMDDLEKAWDLTSGSFISSTVKSAVFIGIAGGTFLCSKLIDTYGRKKFIIIGAGIMLIFSFMCYFSFNWIDYSIYRVFVGVGIGIQMPAGINLASENLPIKYRSIYLSSVWVAFGFGEATCVCLAWRLLPDWKFMMLLASFPMIVTIVLGFLVYESPRYLYAHKKYEEGAVVLMKIEKFNGIDKELLNEDILQEIIKESEENLSNQYKPEIREIFKKKFLGLTLRTWVLWSSSNVGLYLTSFMLPKLLGSSKREKNSSYYVDILISVVMTTPSCFVSGALAEWLGRKGSMVYFSTIGMIASCLIMYTDILTNYWAGALKLASGSAVANIKVYATEAYPTKLRGIGSSSGHAVGRFMTILTPFVGDFLANTFGLKSSFYMVLGFHALGLYCAYSLPFETLGRELDKHDAEIIDSETDIESISVGDISLKIKESGKSTDTFATTSAESSKIQIN